MNRSCGLVLYILPGRNPTEFSVISPRQDIQKQTHEDLDDFAGAFRLRGKGEAVTFTAFVTRALVQRADFDAKAAKMLDDFTDAYHRDRDIHAS